MEVYKASTAPKVMDVHIIIVIAITEHKMLKLIDVTLIVIIVVVVLVTIIKIQHKKKQ